MKAKNALDWLNANGYMPEDWEMVKYITEALEKLLPKEPVEDEYGHKCCPTCGWCVCYDEGWGDKFIPHCENCGQAIDWKR